jgi:hypothetical protein
MGGFFRPTYTFDEHEYSLALAVTLCGFTVAGGFSGNISTGIGNEVLLDAANCSVILGLDYAVSLHWHPRRSHCEQPVLTDDRL